MFLKENWMYLLITLLSVVILITIFTSKISSSEGYILPEDQEDEDEDEMKIEVNPLEAQKGPSFWDQIDEMDEDVIELPDIEFRSS